MGIRRRDFRPDAMANVYKYAMNGWGPRLSSATCRVYKDSHRARQRQYDRFLTKKLVDEFLTDLVD